MTAIDRSELVEGDGSPTDLEQDDVLHPMIDLQVVPPTPPVQPVWFTEEDIAANIEQLEQQRRAVPKHFTC